VRSESRFTAGLSRYGARTSRQATDSYAASFSTGKPPPFRARFFGKSFAPCSSDLGTFPATLKYP